MDEKNKFSVYAALRQGPGPLWQPKLGTEKSKENFCHKCRDICNALDNRYKIFSCKHIMHQQCYTDHHEENGIRPQYLFGLPTCVCGEGILVPIKEEERNQMKPMKISLLAINDRTSEFDNDIEISSISSCEEDSQNIDFDRPSTPPLMQELDELDIDNKVPDFMEVQGEKEKDNEISIIEAYRSAENNEMCNICLEGPLPCKGVTGTISCGHKFHKKCIEEWVEENDSCPTCRSPVLCHKCKKTINVFLMAQFIKCHNICWNCLIHSKKASRSNLCPAWGCKETIKAD